jgi:3',5'-cyclic AMP phosphodiesterase CpdA
MSVNPRQLTIIHLTDLHFGKNHRFNPPGLSASRLGIPKLYQSILKDLAARSPEERAYLTGSTAGSGSNKVRTVFALTGDFTQTGIRDEFVEAEEMFDGLLETKVFGWQIRPRDIFMVPGNHDPQYAENRTEVRWTEYCHFVERHTDAVAAATGVPAPRFRPKNPEKLSRLINQAADGLIVVEVNSSAYVKKGTPDEVCGQTDGGVVPALREAFNAIDAKLRVDAVKIALVHHHPVVMPQLVEDDRGYDGIRQVGPLLIFLKDNDFFLLMHGHKHNPTVFTYDPESA